MMIHGHGLEFKIFQSISYDTSYWGRKIQLALLTVVSMICGMMSVCFSAYFSAFGRGQFWQVLKTVMISQVRPLRWI